MATEQFQRKAARNQALFREVNDRVLEISNGQIPDGEPVYFICECADISCSHTIKLTAEQYEAARRVPTHFPVAPGHVLPDVERVVERHDTYEVVEKYGEVGKAAVQADRENA